MLSRRDKLLVQPWEERRFKDHRSKVRAAQPAVDTRAPAARPHVALKMKKWQAEAERARRVARDNRDLLQRLAAVMRRGRLDNRWAAPPPNFHHKVGLFYDAERLNRKLTARPSADRQHDAAANAKCYACHIKKKSEEKRRSQPIETRSLPCITDKHSLY